ncbi:hypothetical protein [Streptomyces ziwulingensis]|uniref:Peptidase S1 domain-containing protein n=1 Tax=Streptomyces ziwulingensis TaxID=1045501 RepID=A0ABP9CV49_9ACTN
MPAFLRRIVLVLLLILGATAPAAAAPRTAEPPPPPPDRRRDTQPHWGGAALARFATPVRYWCTSGFAVRTRDGKQGMVTAGHCFGQGVRVASGRTPLGEPNDYGTVSERKNDTAHDMEVITGVSAPQLYAPGIWVEPRLPRSIRVVGRAPAATGDKVCFSGMMSKEVCGFEVINLDRGTACSDPEHPTDCTGGLAQAHHPDFAGSDGGDSGSPVYKRDAKGNATIVGMLIGGAPRDPTHPALIVFHTVQQLEASDGLGITVLTQRP